MILSAFECTDMSEIIVSSPNAQSAFYMEEYTYFERYTAHERLEGRQKKIKPMVDDYFVWVKKNQRYVDPDSQTGKAFTYSVNQEQYLRVFLEDPELSMDNNLASRQYAPLHSAGRTG